MQHFAPQLHPAHQPALSLRASQYRRKPTSLHASEPSSSDDSDPDSHSRWSRPNAHSLPSFAPAELAQLRVAGLSPDHGFQAPPPPFPHAPASQSTPHVRPAAVQAELAGPPSRLFLAADARQPEQSNLRRTHLNVLSTVMHRCLLQRDYDRAGRAWGMILRTQATHGSTVDLRNHGRWAIGAEILLRRASSPAAVGSHGQRHEAPDTDVQVDAFSEQGFQLAREYYERLIVQHPTRKQAPHSVDQRSFYPAMFSLWIHHVSEKSKHVRRVNAEASRSRSRSLSLDGSEQGAADDAQSREQALQADELRQAKEIAQRLDDLVKSPPFDKQASLLQLRGNVALWTSDLLVGNTPATPLDEWDVYPIRSDLPAADQMASLVSCQRELHAAHAYLGRVEENGGPRQHHVLAKVESRIKELQKQMASLEAREEDVDVSMETVDEGIF